MHMIRGITRVGRSRSLFRLKNGGLLGNNCTGMITSSGIGGTSSRLAHGDAHDQSLEDPIRFWSDVATKNIDWIEGPMDKGSNVLDTSNPPFYRWFKGSKMNTCFNCLDRHVISGNGDQTALIYDSPVTKTIKKFTFGELLKMVSAFSALLRLHGVKKGNRVLIYMPNTPEAICAMLSCARLGAIHSVVFGGFSSTELAVRIRDCKPKVIISSSCGIDGSKLIPYKPYLDEAIAIASPDHKVEKCIVHNRPNLNYTAELNPTRDVDWEEGLAALPPNSSVECVPLLSEDPLYILYTSGTTGKPKGVLRDNGGHAVALSWAMSNIFNMKKNDVFWAASDIGWVVGHSFMVYGPLIQGCATVIYEGKPVDTPDSSNFWRTVERHRVNCLFTAPTALRAIKRNDPNGLEAKNFDTTSLKSVYLAGEHADASTIQWGERALGCPVIDNWWQTETGWPICTNQIGVHGYLPYKHGSCFKKCPGYDLQVLDNEHKPVPVGKLGNLVIKLPLPPGALLTIWGNDERFVEAYLKKVPGYYDTGDAGYMDEHDYVYVMTRTDDVINVAGHRLSTGQMEEVISEHPSVAEVAVVGVKDAFKGQLPLGLLVLNKGDTRSHADILKEVVELVRAKIGPVAAFKQAVVVERLPKNRSGKVLRATLRSIANHEAFTIPATIEDPLALIEAEEVIRKHEKLTF